MKILFIRWKLEQLGPFLKEHQNSKIRLDHKFVMRFRQLVLLIRQEPH